MDGVTSLNQKQYPVNKTNETLKNSLLEDFFQGANRSSSSDQTELHSLPPAAQTMDRSQEPNPQNTASRTTTTGTTSHHSNSFYYYLCWFNCMTSDCPDSNCCDGGDGAAGCCDD